MLSADLLACTRCATPARVVVMGCSGSSVAPGFGHLVPSESPKGYSGLMFNPLPVGTYVGWQPTTFRWRDDAWRDHSDDLALIIRSGPLVRLSVVVAAERASLRRPVWVPKTVRLRWMVLHGEVLSRYKYQDVEYPMNALHPLTELEVLSRLGRAKKNPSGRAATLSLQISEAKELSMSAGMMLAILVLAWVQSE